MISCSVCKRKYSQQSNSFSFFTTKNRRKKFIWPLKIFFSCKMNLLKPLCLPGEAPLGRIRENSAIYFYKRISCKFIMHSRLKILLKIEIQTCDEENLIKSHSSEKNLYFPPWYKQRHLPKSNKILHPEKRKSWIIGLPFMNSDLSIYIVPF